MLILFSGFTLKSKAQSSCCQLVTTCEVDCYMAMRIKCNGNLLYCTDPANSNQCIPGPCYMGGCFIDAFIIQPGTPANPSTTTTTFDISQCPCDLEIELIGVGFILTGNKIFNSLHTSEHLSTMNGCCPGGIDIVYDPAACTLTITMPTCP